MSSAPQQTDSKQRSRRLHRRGRPALRLLALLLIIVGITGGGLVLMTWLEDRPLAQAESLLADGEFDEALKLVEKYLKTHPQHAQALGVKGQALVGLKRWAESVQAYQRSGPVTDADIRAFGIALANLQHWTEAAAALKEYLRKNPDDAEALGIRISCLTSLGQFADALSASLKYATLPGCHDNGWLMVGMIHRDQGNNRSAVDALSRVINSNPTAEGLRIQPHEFFLVYGRVLFESGRPDDAITWLEKSVAIQPLAEACVFLGNAWAERNQTGRSRAAWKQAVDLDTSNRTAREGLARLALRSRNAIEAVDWLKPIAASDRLRSSTAFLMERSHTMLGHTAEAEIWRKRADQLRRREKVESTANQVLAETPFSFWARVIRAWRFARDGNWRQAGVIVAELMKDPESARVSFLQELAAAVRSRGPLPDLEKLPIEEF